jgi:hypothetical protein
MIFAALTRDEDLNYLIGMPIRSRFFPPLWLQRPYAEA